MPYYGTLRWSQWKLPYIVVLFRLQRTKHHGYDHPIARFAPGERVRDAKKLPRSMVCGPSTWFEACLRGYLVWTWNSEFGVQQRQTEQDTIGSQTKEFARSSRGCPITGSRVFILESPSCGHLSPAVVWGAWEWKSPSANTFSTSEQGRTCSFFFSQDDEIR